MKKEILKKIIAKPGDKHKVSDFDPDYVAGMNKPEAKSLLAENTELLANLQNKLYAHDRYSILIILQAMDAAGKDGTIKHVMSGVNPQGCQVYSFKQPSAEELDHDYLWRISRSLPERGRIGIFNRSHYEDILVPKVHPEILLTNKLPDIKNIEDINEKFWKNRYRQINDYERYLTENGTIILKLFLNISEEEQEKRFISRLEDETKNWKFSASDLKERAYWNDYMKAFSDMLTNTSTGVAPWYVIPANHKWFMRYLVGQIICDKLETLDIHYPTLTAEAKEDIEKFKRVLQDDIESKNNKGVVDKDIKKDESAKTVKAVKTQEAPKGSSKRSLPKKVVKKEKVNA